MDEALNDPWLSGLANVIVFGSLGTWIYIGSRWLRHGHVLPWEPRPAVPWGPPAAILAVAFALMAVSAAWESSDAAAAARDPRVPASAVNIVLLLGLQLLMAGGFFAVISVYYRVTLNDLGLPRSALEGLRDVGLGVVTCFAALLPVQAVQSLLMWLIGRHDELSQHPLIESLTSGGEANVGIMLLACLSAVIVAPICEEVTFRLLLQGWLEKWEDGWLGWRQAPARTDPLYSSTISVDSAPACAIEPPASDENVNQSRDTGGACDDNQVFSSVPPRRGVLGLPYGWLPIFISSFLFGIAHFGYGPEPIPLFFFALFLGYVYQRTHRIIPCIVAHGLFNLVSMVALWRIMVRAIEPGD